MKKTKKTYNHASSTIFTRITKGITAVQRRWADVLGRKTQHWNKNEKIIFLVIITLVFFSANASILIGVFINNGHEGKQFKVGSMPAPILLPRQVDDAQTFSAADTQAVYEFSKAIDSMQRTPEGRKEYEQFLRQRPGFLDSLEFLKKAISQSFYK